MVLDSASADAKVSSDILARLPPDNQFHDLPLSRRETTHTIAHLDVNDCKYRRSVQKRTRDLNRVVIALSHSIAPSLLASAAITL